MIELTNLGLELKKMRNKKGMSIKEAAVLFGVSETTIYWWEEQKRRPRNEHIQKIMAFLGFKIVGRGQNAQN